MRRIGWLLLAMVVLGWLAVELPMQKTPAATADVAWRRTQHGWQRATWLAEPVPPRRPTLHPGVVAALELLLSVMALVAFAPVVGEKHPTSIPHRNPSNNMGLHQDPRPRRRKNLRQSRPA